MTTHPSAFKDTVATVEHSLRYQLHPNFIRWTICNGNQPRQTFAQGLGIAGIVAGIVYGVIITLSNANRGWRALAFLGFFIGIATLLWAFDMSKAIDPSTGKEVDIDPLAFTHTLNSRPMPFEVKFTPRPKDIVTILRDEMQNL